EEPTPGATDTQVPVSDEEDSKKADSCGGQLFSSEERRSLGGTIERLGLQLLENLPIVPQQPNIILSPLSVALALAHLTLGESEFSFVCPTIRSKHFPPPGSPTCLHQNVIFALLKLFLFCFLGFYCFFFFFLLLGAHNETEQLLLKTLHAHNLPCYHHILGHLLPHFKNTSLEVATRMYLRPGFEVKLSFVEESLARYQSRPVPLVSVEEVNHWIENATNGHISNFLESIPHNVMLMLMNAVYFKGEWQTQFDPTMTFKGVFYPDNMKSVSVDMMMSSQYPFRLLHDPELKAQVASFSFKGNTSFLIVMPVPGIGNVSSVLPKLNISDLYRRLPQERIMHVNLPKVKLQYRQELQEALTSMGLGSLFSGPDLSGITDHPLRVGSVRHASTVELSEKGVEASAATVVTTMRSISMFSVNSPFLFAIVDDASLVPLFMGIVTNPAP
ncbi:unnamed protein product, partial [Tetraodon nigroviridis]